MSWDMGDYKPQKITDTGLEPFRAKGRCGVNRALLETRTTEKYDGEVVDMEFEVCDHPEHSGRRLWNMYFLENENSRKQLADLMFTCGLEFKNREELKLCLEAFSQMVLKFSAWPAKRRIKVGDEWVVADPEEIIQRFKILGKADEEEKEPVKATF